MQPFRAPSRSQLKEIGKALAEKRETPEQLDVLDALLAHCDEVQAKASERLNRVLDAFPHPDGSVPYARGRAKTLTTLREKLERMGGHTLPVVRDLAGLRIVGDFTVSDQDQLLDFACETLGVGAEQRKIIDRRQVPINGYRALHAEFVLEGAVVELQVRTRLQHLWAEINERAGDKLGRAIRYSPPQYEDLGSAVEVMNLPAFPNMPEPLQFLVHMQVMSDLIAQVEGMQDVLEGTPRIFTQRRPGSPARVTNTDVLIHLLALRPSLEAVLQRIAESAETMTMAGGEAG